MSAVASFRQHNLGMGSHWQTTIGVGKPPNSLPPPVRTKLVLQSADARRGNPRCSSARILMMPRGWKKRGHSGRLWLSHLMMPSSARPSLGRSLIGWRFGVDNNPGSRAGVLRNDTKTKIGAPAMTSETNKRALFLRIDRSGGMIGRIGDQADVSNQRLDLRLAESIAVGWHQW